MECHKMTMSAILSPFHSFNFILFVCVGGGRIGVSFGGTRVFPLRLVKKHLKASVRSS